MDDKKKFLQGSESRDIFKRCHKQQLDARCYAIDADLVLVRKNPPGIVAYLDFKKPSDNVTFSEVLAYNEWIANHPVYIIQAIDPAHGPFDIYEYRGGDWKPYPPTVELVLIARQIDWYGIQDFENRLRNK